MHVHIHMQPRLPNVNKSKQTRTFSHVVVLPDYCMHTTLCNHAAATEACNKTEVPKVQREKQLASNTPNAVPSGTCIAVWLAVASLFQCAPYQGETHSVQRTTPLASPFGLKCQLISDAPHQRKKNIAFLCHGMLTICHIPYPTVYIPHQNGTAFTSYHLPL